jgi:predicted nucleotidyltransferase
MERTFVHKKNQSFNKRTITNTKLIGFLARYPYDSFSLTEIAKKAAVSKASASKALKDLEREGFIVIGQIANLWRVQYNLNSLAARGFKIAQNITQVYGSGIIEYIIRAWGSPRAIVLFGSVRKGEDGPESDLDIAIEIDHEQETELIGIERFNDSESTKLKEWEKAIGRKIRLCVFHKNRVDPNLYTSIANGITLYGFLDVLAWTKKESKN